MFLSIVVLNYHASDKIIDLLSSIVGQKFNGEVIIVDNSESVSELQKLKVCETILSDNYCKVIGSEMNGGFSFGTNIGIKNVSDETTHVYILNPDTILKDGALEYLVGLISFLPDVMISPRGQRMDNGDNWSYGGKLHYFRGRCDVDPSEKNYTISSDFGTCASLIVPIKFLSKYGLLDEDFFLGGEEWELSVRMKRYGVNIITPSKVIYEHEISGTHKKYGLPFLYMGHRTKVLFMRKCFPKSFVFWLFLYIPSMPFLILRYVLSHKLPIIKSFSMVLKAIYRSSFKIKMTKDEFFSIGDIK